MATTTMGTACLVENLPARVKYLLLKSTSFPYTPLRSLLPDLYESIVLGQKILSPRTARMAGIRVSAANIATTIPIARTMAMDETRLYEQRDMTANPMMTARPDVMTDSPAHFMASVTASDLSFPALRSSLYLEIMKME